MKLPLRKQEMILRRWIKAIWWKALAQLKKSGAPIYTERQYQGMMIRLNKQRVKELKLGQEASYRQFCQLKREWEKIALPQGQPAVYVELSSCNFEKPESFIYVPPRWGHDLSIMVRVSSRMLDLAPMGDSREYLCDMLEREVKHQVRNQLAKAHLIPPQ